MKALTRWFNKRTGLGDLLCWLADTPVSGGAGWLKIWPAVILFTFCIQAMTGFVLWTFYSPSEHSAWESVYYVHYQVIGGWLLRSMHHYSAHVMLAALIIFLVQSIVTRACRPPRELVFWATVGLGLCALAAMLTGDLLSWDQNGYASTKTRTGFLTMLPLVGESLLKLAIGGPGPALGHHTLTRFFALHVGMFGAAFGGLLILYIFLTRRAATEGAKGAEPYWPNQAWRSAAACVVVMLFILLFSLQHGVSLPLAGVPLGSPADTDPANAYSAARPEWFLVGVFEFSHMFPGQWGIVPIFIVPAVLVCILLIMPFTSRYLLGHFFNVAFTVLVVVAVVHLTWISSAKDRADPAHQKAIAAESEQAERVRELARHNGIPPAGALSLLRNDPKTQGPRLFKQHCAACHDHATNDNADDDITAETSSAPNLAKYASRSWLAGLLDPKQVSGPAYFGNTKFRSGTMAGWVKEMLGDLDDDAKADVEKMVVALSAEAQLPSQHEVDVREVKSIEAGRELLADRCTDCHKFHDKGALGTAPDLTGYGSPQWTAGILANPAGDRFYGKHNDRMPVYAAMPDDPAQNILSPHEIELMTNWLRGEWYEE